MAGWLSGYALPPADDPLLPAQQSALTMLRYFFLVLSLSSPADDPLVAGRQFASDLPDFPRSGFPLSAVAALGLGRAQGIAATLQSRLLEGLDADSRAALLYTAG